MSGNADKHQGTCVWYAQGRAKEFGSCALARASEDISAKVEEIVEHLVVKLLEEDNEEMPHKGSCAADLDTNKHTRKVKTQAVETPTAETEGF